MQYVHLDIVVFSGSRAGSTGLGGTVLVLKLFSLLRRVLLRVVFGVFIFLSLHGYLCLCVYTYARTNVYTLGYSYRVTFSVCTTFVSLCLACTGMYVYIGKLYLNAG